MTPPAGSFGVAIAVVETYLDFTVEELRDMICRVDSPNVGVLLDVGNTIGTLDDPAKAAEILGPLTVATHYKDFAIEEAARGFRITTVPPDCGSLRYRAGGGPRRPHLLAPLPAPPRSGRRKPTTDAFPAPTPHQPPPRAGAICARAPHPADPPHPVPANILLKLVAFRMPIPPHALPAFSVKTHQEKLSLPSFCRGSPPCCRNATSGKDATLPLAGQ